MIRILFLLLIASSAYGQAFNLLGFNRQREGVAVPVLPTELSFVDDDTYGTGNNQIEYTGTWTHRSGDKPQAYDNSYTFGNQTNATIVMDFTGVGVEVIFNKYPTHGIAAVSVDGGAETMVDLYDNITYQWMGYRVLGLDDEAHTVTIRVTGTKNAGSTDYWVELDAIGVYSTDTNPPVVVTGDYFVAKTGCTSGCSDSNDGATRLTAKLTIGAAAELAQPGDKINIYAGTYRETAIPTNSGSAGNPIIFQAAEAGVIISGLDDASGGWTVHSGSIYKKTVTLPVNGFNQFASTNTTLAANQVFKDGAMVIQARWPKADNVEELLDRGNLRHRSQTSAWGSVSNSTFNGTITDANIPQISGGLTGAKIFITGWYTSQTGTVTSNSGTTINYTGNNTSLGFNQWYYLTGKLGLLTQANEFHYESGTLYVWQPSGGSPTGIEYKARNYGFDLSGKSYITIRGITFLGCEINGNTATSNIVIDNNRFRYQNHTFMLENPTGEFDKLDNSLWVNMKQTGLKMIGSNNLVTNNEFKYSASQGILAGPNCQIQNNKFEYMDYEGSYACPIAPWENADNIKILYNTSNFTGRSAVDFGWYNLDTHTNLEIGYNNFGSYCMLSSDGAGVYAGRYVDLSGTTVHHNWLHNSYATHSSSSGGNDGINAGLYYDQGTGSNTVNHHNILWDNKQNDFHITTDWAGAPGATATSPRYNPKINRGKAYFYNNTLCTKVYDDWVHGYWSFLNIATQYDDVHRNNIYRARNIQGGWVDVVNGTAGYDTNNGIYKATDPLFVGGSVYNPTVIANPETYFQLQSGSPARNVGATIAGINDGDTGSKDVGAYYYGQTGWVPGYVAVTYTPIP